jgi:hypothetical protein
MEVGQGPNWGCSAKEKKCLSVRELYLHMLQPLPQALSTCLHMCFYLTYFQVDLCMFENAGTILFSPLSLYRKKWKISLLPESLCVFVCVSLYVSLRINILMPEPITWYVYHGTWAHLNGIPPISLCVCMCIPSVPARQRLGKLVPAALNTCNSRRIVGRVVFCAIRVISKDSLGPSVYPSIFAR